MLSLMLNCIGHLLNDFHCFNADSADSLQQVDDVFFVVGKLVGIEEFGDRWIFGLLFFVLVEYPFQGGAVAEFVVPGDRGHARELGVFIQGDDALGFVCLEFGFGFVFAGDVLTGESVGFDRLIVQVQFH